jgi:hypothetical protein
MSQDPNENSMVQALQYARIQNFISNNQDKVILGQKMNITDDNLQTIETEINKILDKTVIKRACCLGRTGPPKADKSTGVQVKIPIPKDYPFATLEENRKKFYQDYGYVNRIVYVDPKHCDATWTKNSPYCNNFMEAYCTNQYEIFKKLNGNDDQKASSNFSTYLEECGCFGKPNPQYAGLNVARRCYKQGCDGTKAYLDSTSKDSSGKPEPCSMTICNSIVNQMDLTAGKGINIDTNITQNCGPQLADAKTKAEAAAVTKSTADKAAADKLVSDKLAADKALTDKSTADKAADKAAADKAAADAKAAADKAAADKAAADKAAADAKTAAAANPNDSVAQKKALDAKVAADKAADTSKAAANAKTIADTKAVTATNKASGGMSTGMIIGIVIGVIILIGIIIFFMTKKKVTPVPVEGMEIGGDMQ